MDFFRHYETFRNFFDCPKGSLFNFLIFCNRMDVKQSQRPPFRFFAHCDTVQNSHFSFFFKWKSFQCLQKFPFSFFRSRKKFSTTYAIVLFFFSRPFHENFKFLKNCPYDIHEILHSHSTPKGAPACAKASKSYGWDVRNIAKISPKMAKKQPVFDFLKNCPYDSNEVFYSYSTPY